jgi:hypothetical protein
MCVRHVGCFLREYRTGEIECGMGLGQGNVMGEMDTIEIRSEVFLSI